MEISIYLQSETLDGGDFFEMPDENDKVEDFLLDCQDIDESPIITDVNGSLPLAGGSRNIIEKLITLTEEYDSEEQLIDEYLEGTLDNERPMSMEFFNEYFENFTPTAIADMIASGSYSPSHDTFIYSGGRLKTMDDDDLADWKNDILQDAVDYYLN